MSSQMAIRERSSRRGQQRVRAGRVTLTRYKLCRQKERRAMRLKERHEVGQHGRGDSSEHPAEAATAKVRRDTVVEVPPMRSGVKLWKGGKLKSATPIGGRSQRVDRGARSCPCIFASLTLCPRLFAECIQRARLQGAFLWLQSSRCYVAVFSRVLKTAQEPRELPQVPLTWTCSHLQSPRVNATAHCSFVCAKLSDLGSDAAA